MPSGEPTTRNLFREAACCYAEALVDALVEDALMKRVDGDVRPLLDISESDIRDKHVSTWQLDTAIKSRCLAAQIWPGNRMCAVHCVRPKAWNILVGTLRQAPTMERAEFARVRRVVDDGRSKCVVFPPALELALLRDGRRCPAGRFDGRIVDEHVANCGDACPPRCDPMRRGNEALGEAVEKWFSSTWSRIELFRSLDRHLGDKDVDREYPDDDTIANYLLEHRRFDISWELGVDEKTEEDAVGSMRRQVSRLVGHACDAWKEESGSKGKRASLVFHPEDGDAPEFSDCGGGDPEAMLEEMEERCLGEGGPNAQVSRTIDPEDHILSALGELAFGLRREMARIRPEEMRLVMVVHDLLHRATMHWHVLPRGDRNRRWAKVPKDSDIFRAIVWGYRIPERWMKAMTGATACRDSDMGDFVLKIMASCEPATPLEDLLVRSQERDCLQRLEKLRWDGEGRGTMPLEGAWPTGWHISEEAARTFRPFCMRVRAKYKAAARKLLRKVLGRLNADICELRADADARMKFKWTARSLAETLVPLAEFETGASEPPQHGGAGPLAEAVRAIGFLGRQPEGDAYAPDGAASPLGECKWCPGDRIPGLGQEGRRE